MRVRDISLIDVMKKYARLHETDFQKEGNNRWVVSCLNPEHRDGKPSLNVYNKTADGEGWDYYCYTCKFSGNAMNLLVSLGVAKDTDEAKGILMEDFGLTPPSVMNLVNFCEYKGIDPKFARDNGWEDIEGGLLIPFYSEDDVVIAKKVRTRFDGKPKYYYISRPEYESNPPYGLHWLRDYTDDVLYITEGETDASTMAQAGLQALGIPSTNAWNSKYAEKIRRFKKIIVVKDNDAAGDNLVNALKEDFPDKTYVLLLPRGTKDINSYYTDVCGCDAEKFIPKIYSLAIIPSGRDTFLKASQKDITIAKDLQQYRFTVGELVNPIDRAEFIGELAKHTGYAKKDLNAMLDSADKMVLPSLPEWYSMTKTGRICLDPYKYAQFLAKEKPICLVGGEWYLYHDGVYNHVADAYINNLIINNLIDECKSDPSNIKNTLYYLQNDVNLIKTEEDFDNDPYLMNLRNGIFNIATGELTAHTTEYLSMVQRNVSYDPAKADSSVFAKYLNDKIPNETNQKLAQEILGYTISNFTNAEKWFLLQGGGRSGKGTFLDIITAVLGSENISNVSLQNIGDRFQKSRLFGKLANIDADLPIAPIRESAVEILKKVVGRDYIDAEYKGKDGFNFRPKLKLIYACNGLPQNTGDSSYNSFWIKLIILKMGESDVGNVDTMFKYKLTQPESLNAIFLWALEGLHRLIANDFVFSIPEDSVALLEDYRVRSNNVLSFATECCEVGDPKDGYYISTEDFMNAYTTWLEKDGRGGRTAKKSDNVGDVLTDYYGAGVYKGRKRFSTDRNPKAYFVGIRLITDTLYDF